MPLVPPPVPAGMRFAHVTWSRSCRSSPRSGAAATSNSGVSSPCWLPRWQASAAAGRPGGPRSLATSTPPPRTRSQGGGAARHAGGSLCARGGYRRRRPTAGAGLLASRPGGPSAAASGRTPGHLLGACGYPHPPRAALAVERGDQRRRALTESVRDTGYELRLSRNKSPIR
jgi:hypothetical protein